MKPVYVFAKWQVQEGRLNDVLALLKEVAEKSRSEKGNLIYQVHQSTVDTSTILLYEGYIDQTAADTHRNSDHFQKIVLQAIVPLLEKREVTIASAPIA